MGDALFPLPYPSILGFDIAVEVVEVCSSVSRFTPGDRVLGQALALKNNKASEGAFQTYTVLLSHMVSPIPSNLSLKPLLFSPLVCLPPPADYFNWEGSGWKAFKRGWRFRRRKYQRRR